MKAKLFKLLIASIVIGLVPYNITLKAMEPELIDSDLVDTADEIYKKATISEEEFTKLIFKLSNKKAEDKNLQTITIFYLK